MKFDRKAPGEGIDMLCKVDNGRASIEWKFMFSETEQEEKGMVLHLTMRDRAGQTVLLCMQEALEEEPLLSVILQPHLWDCENPYLYELEAVLQDAQGKERDRLKRQIPLRELSFHERRGWLLNGEELVLKAVEYTIPPHTSALEKQQIVLRDLQLVKEMGANCIHTEASLWPLCERLGLLTWQKGMERSGGELPCLVGEGGSRLSSLYYCYKAKWSREPFVYIVPESISILSSGKLSVIVYSNCSRVALYSDGILFEFRKGNEEFLFEEIPARTPCVMLSAEGENCSMSLSFHKTFAHHGAVL